MFLTTALGSEIRRRAKGGFSASWLLELDSEGRVLITALYLAPPELTFTFAEN